LLDATWNQGGMSFVEQFAAPLPGYVMSELLGLPEADVPRFTAWVGCVSRSVGFAFRRGEVPEMEAAARDLNRYVENLLHRARAAPDDDFLSVSVTQNSQEEALSPLEAVIQIVTAILGGSDTTRQALAIQVALLLQHREQWDAVCRNPGLVPD